MFRHDCPLAVQPASTPRRLLPRKTWTDSLPTDMLLSAAVSVLVAALPSSEVPEGLMNYPVCSRVFPLRRCFSTYQSLSLMAAFLNLWVATHICVAKVFRVGIEQSFSWWFYNTYARSHFIKSLQITLFTWIHVYLSDTYFCSWVAAQKDWETLLNAFSNKIMVLTIFYVLFLRQCANTMVWKISCPNTKSKAISNLQFNTWSLFCELIRYPPLINNCT
jgi:hypothetical protein